MGNLNHPERHGCREIEDPFTAAMNGAPPAVAAQLEVTTKYRVYPGRFYVLIAFALLAGQQALAWMTFGTIPNETYTHFGLTDNDVTLLSGKHCPRMYIKKKKMFRMRANLSREPHPHNLCTVAYLSRISSTCNY